MVVPVRTKIYPIYAPARGLSLNVPAPFLTPQATPDCKNVRFYDQIVEKRTGYSPDTYAGGTITGTPLKLYTYTNEDGTDYEILATTTNIIQRTTSDWADVDTTIGADIDNRISMCTMHKDGDFKLCVGSKDIIAHQWDGDVYNIIPKISTLIADCEGDDWETYWDIPNSAEFGLEPDDNDFKVGAGSMKISVATAATAGMIAVTKDFSEKDISNCTKIRLWIKSDEATSSGDLQFLLDDNSQCASPIETLDIPELTAGVWTRVELSLGFASSDTAIISLGLKYTVDIAPGTWNIRLDDIRAIYPMIYKPKIIIPYQYRLLMFNLEEDVDTVGGGSYTKTFPVKFRYSRANDMHDWVSTGSGSRNMIQGAGSEIMNAVAIKDYVGVYKDKSISVLDYVGGSSIFATSVHIDGIGLLAQDAIVNLGTSHIFLASDYNIYEWNGGWELIPIGNAIKKYIKENIYKTNKSRCFAVPNYERTEVHFFIPIKTEVDETPEYPNRFLTYNWTDKTWALNTIASCSGGGNLNTDGVEKTMIALYSDTTGNTVHNYDYSSKNDGDTEIDSYFTTPDITIDKQEYKIKRKDYKNVYVDAKGDDLSMFYSTSEGSTDSWVETTISSTPPLSTTIYNLHAFNFATAARNIRFKFANTVKGETYAVRFVGVEHKDVGRK